VSLWDETAEAESGRGDYTMPTSQRPMSRSERRRFERLAKSIRLRARLRKTDDSEVCDAHTSNVSVGGVGVKFRRESAVGARLAVTFLDIGPSGGFEVDGIVVWCEYDPKTHSYDTGVEFQELSPDQAERLLMVISERAWEPGGQRDSAHFRLGRNHMVEYRKAGGLLRRRWRPGACNAMSLREIVLISEEKPQPQTTLALRVHLQDGKSEPIECEGVVVGQSKSHRPTGWEAVVAIQQVSQEDRMRMAGFLSQLIVE